MAAQENGSYPRRILISVTGLTPQVVTESLHVLVTERRFIPTEIHLITTSHGRNRAVRDLLDSQTGQFHAFCRDFGISGRIRFDASMIHVIEDGEGNELPDIRTPEENTRAADAIVKFVQKCCSEEDAAVHVSLAGGRKTMGFFAGYALSLFGRPQDGLSHVLVGEPFENNRDFFYPAQRPRTIFAPTGEPLDASTAKVMLAEIPFVRLREGLPEELLNGRTTYSRTVEVAQSRIVPPVTLGFALDRQAAILGDVEIEMPPLLLAVYLWLAARRARRAEPVRPGSNAQPEEFLRVYLAVTGEGSADYENAARALRHADDFLPYFQEKRTRINKIIQSRLGEKGSKPYRIDSIVKRLNTRYELTIDPEAITLPASVRAIGGTANL